MKTIYMTLAAVSALAVTAPVAAQPQYAGDRQSSEQLQARFDAGVQSGAISRTEARPLRMQMRQFMQMERDYSRAGFTARETRQLRERSRSLNLEMTNAEQTGNGRYGQGERYGQGYGAGDPYNDGRANGVRGDFAMGNQNRGDRYAGDVRVGEHFSDRQVALPIQYRDRYRDDNASFYRYDNERVYQINRNTGLVMAMFDIGR
jgi:hypothetical protein